MADVTEDEHNRRLVLQERDNKWHKFVEGNLILHQGLLDKRKVTNSQLTFNTSFLCVQCFVLFNEYSSHLMPAFFVFTVFRTDQ